jgi:hypothetical protein
VKKSLAVRAQGIGLRPCFIRGLRRFAIVYLRYALAFVASELLATFLVPPLSRALYALGVTRTYVSEVSFNLEVDETWTYLLAGLVAFFVVPGILGASLHCGLVAAFLPMLVRGRRRLTRYVMRCSAHRGGWLAAAAAASLFPAEMLGFSVVLPLLYICAIVVGAIIFLRYRYWGRARRITRMCLHCDYILRGLPDVGRCPECGTPYGSLVDAHAAAHNE